MRFIAVGLLVAAVAGCKSNKGAPAEKPDEPADETPAAATPEVPPDQPAVSPGVAPIASAPRADWPCAKSIDSVGARVTYDYTGAPDECWFPPDLWQPGCPTRHVQANPAMGIEIEVRYSYDDRNRLSAIDSELAMMKVESIEYDGDQVVSQDQLSYYPADGAVHMRWDDGSFYAVAELRDGVGIARLRTGGDSPTDDDVMTDERFEFEGTRLAKIRGAALGTEEVHAYEYDCE